MKRTKVVSMIISIFLSNCIAYAVTINVPADQPTIQDGINVSADGDIVLVQPGTYVENINFEGKAIILASLFHTTQDTSYISQTIIDGNQNGTVVTFENNEDNSTSLIGFTITNGYYNSGAGIRISDAGPILDNLRICENSASGYFMVIQISGVGTILSNLEISNNSSVDYHHVSAAISSSGDNISISNLKVFNNDTDGCRLSGENISMQNIIISNNNGNGILLENTDVSLNNVVISNNTTMDYGAGIWCGPNSDIFLENVTIKNNVSRSDGGGIYRVSDSSFLTFSPDNRSNIYNNSAQAGNDIYFENYDFANVIVDTFTVISPTDYHIYSEYPYDFEALNGKIEQVNNDLYVSNTGDNNNSGLTPTEPLRNIYYALSKIQSDISNPHTIYLADGTYSPSTNQEVFPLTIVMYTNLLGESRENVVINSEETSSVMSFYDIENSSLEKMIITNADQTTNYGAVIIEESTNIELTDMLIADNNIKGIYCSGSSIEINDVDITNNGDEGIYAYNSDLVINDSNFMNNDNGMGQYTKGGGIYTFESNIQIINCTITDNIAGNGGGAYFYGGDVTIENSSIVDNYAHRGAGLYFEGANIIMNNTDILSNSTSQGGEHKYGGGIYSEISNAVLDNINIQQNYSDHRGGGIYIRSSDFVIYNSNFNENISSSGFAIYAYQNSIIELDYVNIDNNYGWYALNFIGIEYLIQNSNITNNNCGIRISMGTSGMIINSLIANNDHWGLFCDNGESPMIINTTIANNTSNGIECEDASEPILVNSILWGNEPNSIEFSSDEDSCSIIIAYSDIENGENGININGNGEVFWLDGNIDLDPQFIDVGTDYGLLSDSPCIDAGIAFFEWQGETILDLSPEEYEGIAPDMGVYGISPVSVEDEVIEENISENYYLAQNFPNPFNPTTTISFSISNESNVKLYVYNIKGQKVKTLANDYFINGTHLIVWNGEADSGEKVSSGIYFYQLIINGKTEFVKKCVLLK